MLNRYLSEKVELTKEEADFGMDPFVLEYYIIESCCEIEEAAGKSIFGIEVVKTQGELVENAVVNDYSLCREETQSLLQKLSFNKVTPVGLLEVVSDLVGV